MPVPVRDASTVLALRDGERGLEVYMVKRSSKLSFFGGHHVFPGGAVDEEDRGAGFDELLAGLDLDKWAGALGLDDRARVRGHIVAAFRELFEEAGILLAERPGGGHAALADVVEGSELLALRLAIAGGDEPFEGFLRKHGLQLATGDLCYFAHWITPPNERKRFDTRFFLARMPEGQSARHDRVESSEGGWTSPGDALAAYGRREIELLPPTICSLDWLALYASVDEALAAAAALEVVEVLPKISVDGDNVSLLYPGDADYDAGQARPVEPGRQLNRLVLRDGLWVRP